MLLEAKKDLSKSPGIQHDFKIAGIISFTLTLKIWAEKMLDYGG
jgi:hypothetical protein